MLGRQGDLPGNDRLYQCGGETADSGNERSDSGGDGRTTDGRKRAERACLDFAPGTKPVFQRPSAAGSPLSKRAHADAADVQARIKWPNDVVIGGKKTCGILTELFFSGNGGYWMVTGIGINVNQEKFPAEIETVATSLKREKGREYGREELLACVLNELTNCFQSVCSSGDLSALREEYEGLLANRMERVEVLDPAGSWKGTALGIDDTGRLLVRRNDGSVEAVFAGEVSVRGIYGYV